MTRDGAVLISGHMDGALRLWDVRSGNKARDLAALHKGALTSVDVGLSGRLLLTCAKDSTLAVVDTRMWDVVGRLQAPGFTVAGKHTKACLAPNEAYVAAGVGASVLAAGFTDVCYQGRLMGRYLSGRWTCRRAREARRRRRSSWSVGRTRIRRWCARRGARCLRHWCRAMSRGGWCFGASKHTPTPGV